MIDIWLLCGLTIPFLVFILEVTSEMIRHSKAHQNFNKEKIANNLQHFIPLKSKDNIPLLIENSRKMAPAEQSGEAYNGILMKRTKSLYNKAHKGTQANKVERERSEHSFPKDEGSEYFTVLEKAILIHKKTTIPVLTSAFIVAYAIAAITNYVNLS